MVLFSFGNLITLPGSLASHSNRCKMTGQSKATNFFFLSERGILGFKSGSGCRNVKWARDECLSPRVRLEGNPEIPVAPGEEHWLLDFS